MKAPEICRWWFALSLRVKGEELREMASSLLENRSAKLAVKRLPFLLGNTQVVVRDIAIFDPCYPEESLVTSLRDVSQLRPNMIATGSETFSVIRDRIEG